ncbi:MAG: DUF1990 family protein [Anaerolineae bacterium]
MQRRFQHLMTELRSDADPSVRRRNRWIGGTAALLGGITLGWLVRRWHQPMNETVTHVATTAQSPEPPVDTVGDRPLQGMYAGTGDLFHRRYQVDVKAPSLSKEAVMERIYADINAFVPHEWAVFEKTKGDPERWAIGDEWFVHLTGPWDGPVRLIRIEPTGFAFATLEGHLEAGEIQFEVSDVPGKTDALRFEIRSWARSRDRITDLFYRILGVSKLAQTIVWTYFCGKVVEISGGTRIDKMRVTTHRTRYRGNTPPEPPPLWKRYEHDFERWNQSNLNFDPTQRETFTDKLGWRIDDYSVGLPSEPPGDPLPHGSWQAACDVVRNYEFPDPGLITGIFVPDTPLESRIMILRARFLFFTFYFGVRIADVIDEVRHSETSGDARVWGYGYRTLEGHFEMGEITFQVWKRLATGEVEFRVHAYSKTARIRNPFYRLGFRIFGRSLQRRFARTAMQRMQQLVIARTAPTTDLPKEAVPDAQTEVQPVSADETANRKKDEIEENLAADGSET